MGGFIVVMPAAKADICLSLRRDRGSAWLMHRWSRSRDRSGSALQFREILRCDLLARERYEAVKLRLLEEVSSNRNAYTVGKTLGAWDAMTEPMSWSRSSGAPCVQMTGALRGVCPPLEGVAENRRGAAGWSQGDATHLNKRVLKVQGFTCRVAG